MRLLICSVIVIPYFSTMYFACSAVVPSGAAGPEAILSILSPMTSDKTMLYTFAGMQASANLPPLTAEKRFLSVFISFMSAPEARSSWVSLLISSAGISGFSKSAEPPPERRNSTVSPSPRGFTSSSTFSVAA